MKPLICEFLNMFHHDETVWRANYVAKTDRGHTGCLLVGRFVQQHFYFGLDGSRICMGLSRDCRFLFGTDEPINIRLIAAIRGGIDG